MKGLARKGLLLLATALLTVASVGCPNSTVIGGGTGSTQLDIQLTNLTRFDQGFFDLKIRVRPLDPNASQAQGSFDLALLPVGAPVDTTVSMVDPLFLSPVQLGQGVYEVVEIQLNQMFFFDSTFPTDPSTCESYQSFYSPPGPIRIMGFATTPTFTVLNSQDTVFTLTFDMTQMMTTLNNAYTCSAGCGAFCITNFNASQFAADTLDYLTFD